MCKKKKTNNICSSKIRHKIIILPENEHEIVTYSPIHSLIKLINSIQSKAVVLEKQNSNSFWPKVMLLSYKTQYRFTWLDIIGCVRYVERFYGSGMRYRGGDQKVKFPVPFFCTCFMSFLGQRTQRC